MLTYIYSLYFFNADFPLQGGYISHYNNRLILFTRYFCIFFRFEYWIFDCIYSYQYFTKRIYMSMEPSSSTYSHIFFACIE